MLGVGAFGPLAALTSVGVAVMVAGLSISSRLGLGISSVWFSLLGFHLVQLVGTMIFHFKMGPLAVRGDEAADDELPQVECTPVPVVGEVCVVDEAPANAL
jgi:ABC-type nickel/cobalt efflux system permease component RcnA